MKKSSNSYSDDSEVFYDDQRLKGQSMHINLTIKIKMTAATMTTNCAGAVCHHRRGCHGEGGGGPPGDLNCSQQSKQGVVVVVVVIVVVVVLLLLLLLTTR